MKEKYLRNILEKKQDWTKTTTVFNENHIQVMIKEKDSFVGNYPIYLAEDCVFEAYIESLKGIVVPIEPYLISSTPIIHYRIDVRSLESRSGTINHEFIYEDQLTCYYPGGKTVLYFKIQILNNRNRNQETSGEVIKKSESVTMQEHKDFFASLRPDARTYSNKSNIKVIVQNRRQQGRNILVEWSEDAVFPKKTDLYLKSDWESDFLVRLPVGEKLLGFLGAKKEPIFHNQLLIRDGDTKEPLFERKVCISLFPKYAVDLEIETSKEYVRARIQIMKDFVDLLLERTVHRSNKELMERMKACLNYNQEDIEMRMLLIILCFETGAMINRQREAVVELERIARFQQYYEKTKYYEGLRLLFELVDEKGKREEKTYETGYIGIAGFIFLRYFARRQERYRILKELYIQGERSCFLFAISVALLNKMTTIPEVNDGFYISCLQWALNHQVLSKEWLHRIERYAYALENHDTIQSFLVEKIYITRPTKSILKLLCHLIVKEERKDAICFRYLTEGLEEKIRNTLTDQHYFKLAEAWNQEIRFDLYRFRHTFLDLSPSVREYIYLQIVRRKAENMFLYRKVKEEILMYLVEAQGEQRYNKLFMYMFEELEPYMNRLMDSKNLSFLPIVHYIKLYPESTKILCLKAMICDELPEVVYTQYLSLNDKEKEEVKAMVIPYLSRKILIEEYNADPRVLEEIRRYYEEKRDEIGMLYLLMRYSESFLQGQVRLLLEHGHQLHTLLLPEEKKRKCYQEVFYLSKESDRIIIYYRYPEDTAYQQKEMLHLAYGLFGFLVKLYYGEVMDYYLLVVHENGVEEIVVSDQVRQTEVDLFAEDEVGIRISQMCYSLEIGDFEALRQLSQEQNRFDQYTKLLGRI